MITKEQLEAELASLNQELADFDVKQRRRGLVMEWLKTFQPSSPNNPTGSIPQADLPFSGLGTTAAIFAFLKANSGVFYTAKEITKAIQAGGVQVNSPNFSTTVHTTCSRKSQGEKAELEQGEKDGSKAYRIKPDAV